MTSLTGKRIVVTRPRVQAADLCDKLAALGAIPIRFPTIEIAPLDDYTALDQALARLANYQWIIFTSVNGVSAFWQRLEAAGENSNALDGIRVAAIGPATARALEKRGIAAQFIPDEYVAEAMVEGMGDVRGQGILLPRADIAREALADGLRKRGAIVDEIAAYHTLIVDAHDSGTLNLRAMLQHGEIDAITFTSSSTARGFVQAIDLRTEIKNPNSKIVIACIGPITARTVRDLGLPVDVTATEYTMDGLVAALVQHFQEEP
jgi:uroporphyrinogen III methyltransferase/synthase